MAVDTDMNTDRLYAIVVMSLAMIMVAVVIVLLVGLFNPIVDNKAIFAIIGPAFQTVVGAFVGLLSGKALTGPRE
jgi:hypothetical protein